MTNILFDALNIKELREKARKELPRMIFDYADGGAGDEGTLKKNEIDFGKYEFLPRPLQGSENRDLSVEVFGHKLKFPLIIGPTSLSGIFWPNGEQKTADAAEKFGIGYCLGHGSVCAMEEMRSDGESPRWMQVFIYQDRGFTREFCDRAYSSNFEALVLTIDSQILGKRERDIKNSFLAPPRFTVSDYVNFLAKYKWLWRMRSHLNRISFGNYINEVKKKGVSTGETAVADMLDTAITWKDVEWLRKIWKKPLILKGILNPDDVKSALASGVDGIIVSNHGGRQLDCVVSSIDALPEIIDNIEGKIPVFMDGGIRRGADIVKALALGAKACLIGRPHLWGLAVGGELGVEKVISILHDEVDLTMGLCGISSISEISKDLIRKI